jgi:hypothetical protein
MACKCCCDCDSDKPIRVYFCPKCKSRDVKYIFELRNAFGVIPKMRCGKCGIEMPTFPVLVTTKKLLEESVSKKKNRKKKSGGKRR